MNIISSIGFKPTYVSNVVKVNVKVIDYNATVKLTETALKLSLVQ